MFWLEVEDFKFHHRWKNKVNNDKSTGMSDKKKKPETQEPPRKKKFGSMRSHSNTKLSQLLAKENAPSGIGQPGEENPRCDNQEVDLSAYLAEKYKAAIAYDHIFPSPVQRKQSKIDLRQHCLKLYQLHIEENAPLKIGITHSTSERIRNDITALFPHLPTLSSSYSASPTLTSSITLSLSPPSSSPLAFDNISSPHSLANLLPFSSSPEKLHSLSAATSFLSYPVPNETLFDEAQSELRTKLAKEDFPRLLDIFVTTAIEALNECQPLPQIVFEEFEREFSSQGEEAAGWEFLESIQVLQYHESLFFTRFL